MMVYRLINIYCLVIRWQAVETNRLGSQNLANRHPPNQTRYINCACQVRTSVDNKIKRKYNIKRNITKMSIKAEESTEDTVSCGILWQNTSNSCAINAVKSLQRRQWYQSVSVAISTSRLKCSSPHSSVPCLLRCEILSCLDQAAVKNQLSFGADTVTDSISFH